MTGPVYKEVGRGIGEAIPTYLGDPIARAKVREREMVRGRLTIDRVSTDPPPSRQSNRPSIGHPQQRAVREGMWARKPYEAGLKEGKG